MPNIKELGDTLAKAAIELLATSPNERTQPDVWYPRVLAVQNAIRAWNERPDAIVVEATPSNHFSVRSEGLKHHDEK